MSDIKYRHPENHELAWTGRGRAPKWYEAALQMGFTAEQLDVENQMRSLEPEASTEIDLGIGEAKVITDADDHPTMQLVVAELAQPSVEVGPVVDAEQSEDAGGEVDQIRLSEWIGQRKFSAALQKLLTVSDLVELQKMKESKSYKGLRVISQDGNPLMVSSFFDLCESIGASEPHVNEQLLNLRTFGPEFLSFADKSIGYREMRQLRRLPSDQREALAQIASTGTKDDVLEAAYEAIEAERSKRSELEVQNADLSDDLKMAEKRGKNLDAEIERQELKIKKLSSARQRCTDFLDRTEEIRAECMALQAEAELPLAAIEKLFIDLCREPEAPEWRQQVEQVWITAHVIASRAAHMVGEVRGLGLTLSLPDHIGGTHILTPAEAQRWLLDYPMIANRHEAEAAQRKEAREAARPKGPGRPKGSTNKAAEE